MTRRPRLILSGAIAATVIGLLGAGLAHLAGAEGAGLPVVRAAVRPRSRQ